jgi:ABC-type nitrate/sulfonate/bicarbonate transport system substrate-binding protein
MPVVNFALDYTPTTANLGVYVAQALGYYTDSGIRVKILPYSNTSSDTLINAGQADFGDTFQNSIMSDQAAGENIISTGAIEQHADSVIVYRGDDTSIKTPANLDGKTYGGFGYSTEKAMVAAIIKGGGGAGNYKYIVINTQAYPALASHQIDFTQAEDTWEVPQAQLQGHPFGVFKFQTYGLPDDYEEVIAAKVSWLDQHQAAAKQFMAATQRGYEYAAAHPDEAAQLFIKEVPTFSTQPQLVKASSELLAKGWFLSPNGKWGYQTLPQWTTYGHWFYTHGLLKTSTGHVLTTEPNWTVQFTNQYLS